MGLKERGGGCQNLGRKIQEREIRLPCCSHPELMSSLSHWKTGSEKVQKHQTLMFPEPKIDKNQSGAGAPGSSDVLLFWPSVLEESSVLRVSSEW